MRLFNLLKKYYAKIPLSVTNILGYLSNIIPASKTLWKVFEQQFKQLERDQYATKKRARYSG